MKSPMDFDYVKLIEEHNEEERLPGKVFSIGSLVLMRLDLMSTGRSN